VRLLARPRVQDIVVPSGGAEDHGRRQRLGVLVRRSRLDLGWGQNALALRTGISLRTLRDIEAGRATRPRVGSVHRLADLLMLPAREIADVIADPVASPEIRLEALGRPMVRRGGEQPGSRSLQLHAFVGLLALQSNRVVSLDEIVEYAGDDQPEEDPSRVPPPYALTARPSRRGSSQVARTVQLHVAKDAV
jgi:transcriptional regulator with XRE-family HTH domain